MTVSRTAWVFMWVLHAAQHTQSQVTTCTAIDQECVMAAEDMSSVCATEGTTGICINTFSGLFCAKAQAETNNKVRKTEGGQGSGVYNTKPAYQNCAVGPNPRDCTCSESICFKFAGVSERCATPQTTSACPDGADVCDDPHMKGLRGQKIDWSGTDGQWYNMVKDEDADLHVNIRVTAPLPVEFPDRQLITGLSVLTGGHTLVIEVNNPYDVDTNGCPSGVSPCLSNGGLRAVVDGKEENGLLRFCNDEPVVDGITVSAVNLPVECRQFGGDKIWARMYDEMLDGSRQLVPEEDFEDWILRFEDMAAPEWCRQYIKQHDLADLQSIHAVFKIVTPAATVRMNVGTNHQGDGDVDWDGRVLPDLEFWQMDVGLHGLSLENEFLSGILGETARPVLDKDGREVMDGYEAFRGSVDDYRVSGSLGTDFALLHKL